VTTLARLLDLLPPPYSAAPDSLLSAVLATFALEFDAIQEDLDRLRRTHWIGQTFRLEDAAKLGDLCGIDPLPWESLESFRARLLPLIRAQLSGALGRDEISEFVFDYLRNAQEALGCTFVQGLSACRDADAAFDPPADRPGFRPFGFDEFPARRRRSATLTSRAGLVPVLFRWTETNRGLDECVPRIRITGVGGRRTVVPLLANLTTGEMLLFGDRLLAGSELSIEASGDGDGTVTALLDGTDVTVKLRSMSGFAPGIEFDPARFDAQPRLPRLPRGDSEWLFLSVGLYDVRGLDRFFFWLADNDLREGRFDETRFDKALFRSEPAARLEIDWTEREGGAFELRVPRTIVVEPTGSAPTEHPYMLVADALERAVAKLHAAGVRAAIRYSPFAETQGQEVRHTLPWVWVDRERGSAGSGDGLEFGFHFEETGLGQARFE
jgi:hypothetical protein